MGYLIFLPRLSRGRFRFTIAPLVKRGPSPIRAGPQLIKQRVEAPHSNLEHSCGRYNTRLLEPLSPRNYKLEAFLAHRRSEGFVGHLPNLREPKYPSAIDTQSEPGNSCQGIHRS